MTAVKVELQCEIKHKLPRIVYNWTQRTGF